MVVNLFDIAEFYMEIVRKLRFDVVILRLSSLGVTIYDIQARPYAAGGRGGGQLPPPPPEIFKAFFFF